MDNGASQADTDVGLMARVATGERSALGELVKRHQQGVFELAFRTTGDRALAEDIVQETFLRIWRSARRYRPTARFGTWLYRIVVNLCLDAFKRRKPLTGLVLDDAQPDPCHPAMVMERLDRSLAVRAAVAALPDRQRLAVVLHRFSGFSLRAITEATGWSESAVESLLVRAYATLRLSLKSLDKK